MKLILLSQPRPRLRAITENKKILHWITPDDIYACCNTMLAVSFIYNHDTNELYTGESNHATHGCIGYSMKDKPELLQRYNAHRPDRSQFTTAGDLTGRIGTFASLDYRMDIYDYNTGKSQTIDLAPDFPRQHIISFWNVKPEHYENLDKCLNKLYQEGLATKRDFISTPLHGTYRISEPSDIQQLSPEEQERIKILKDKPHELRGADKKNALEKLGVRSQTQTPPTTT